MAPPRAMVEQLPKGHGGIVEVENKKVGVYKDKKWNITYCTSQVHPFGLPTGMESR